MLHNIFYQYDQYYTYNTPHQIPSSDTTPTFYPVAFYVYLCFSFSSSAFYSRKCHKSEYKERDSPSIMIGVDAPTRS
jgi:hypothetical protein